MMTAKKGGTQKQRQTKLDEYKMAFLPSMATGKGIPLQVYRELKKAETERREKSRDIMTAIRTKKYKRELIGQGREFRVYTFYGINRAVVLKKQRADSEFYKYSFEEAAKSAKRHIKAHNQWRNFNVPITQRYTAQLQIVKTRPIHVVEKILPLLSYVYLFKNGKRYKTLNSNSLLSAEELKPILPKLLNQIETFYKSQKGKEILRIDSLLSNWGISEKGEVLYLDTFHGPAEAQLPTDYKKPMLKRRFFFNQDLGRLLSSIEKAYKNKPEDLQKIRGIFTDELTAKIGKRRMNKFNNWYADNKQVLIPVE